MDKRFIKRIIIFTLLSLLFFSFPSYADISRENIVVCDLDENNMFSEVISQILPSYEIVKDANRVFNDLANGAVVEAFDFQAHSAIKQKIAKYWYPMCLATVIIAIDRDSTDVFVSGWEDLSDIQENVSFFTAKAYTEIFTIAMSYGLEGEKYSLKRAINILSKLKDDGYLVSDPSDAAIMICYDYQAASLIESGRNIEIVIPVEGTYTYTKGLLSKHELTFLEDVDDIILKAGFITLDENRRDELYPDKSSYAPADRVTDFEHFSVINQDAIRIIRREVFGIRTYTSADVRENQALTLIYLVFIAAWVALVMWRVMQKSVRSAVAFTGIVLICWVIARLIKWQAILTSTFTRYLWYSYYVFQFSLALALLWMALAIDKPQDTISSPKWFKVLTAIDVILVLLVFTNDIHNLVFKFDLSNSLWNSKYTYGPVFYIICASMIITIISALVIFIFKSRNNPRKSALPFPLIFFCLLLLYGYGYITRVPLAWESDFTMVVGIFTLLFIETAIQSGLIPSNMKYLSLFANSPFYMEIVDVSGKAKISSKRAKSLAEKNSYMPISEDLSISQKPIDGGFVILQKDLSAVNSFQRELSKLSENLRNANSMLIDKRESERSLKQAKAQMQLMEQLENEISDHIETLSEKIDNLPNVDNIKKDTVQIALLICYIKRRCNLFFREQENSYLIVDELAHYIDELCEIAGHSMLKVIPSYKLFGEISLHTSILMYDLFYEFVNISIDNNIAFILCNIEKEDDTLLMSILPSEDFSDLQIQHRILPLIDKTTVNISAKNFEDVTGFTITFYEGGCK